MAANDRLAETLEKIGATANQASTGARQMDEALARTESRAEHSISVFERLGQSLKKAQSGFSGWIGTEDTLYCTIFRRKSWWMRQGLNL